MDQTLGKRIAAHRKQLGMTQDSLAEQLGVTAQAVSKWENDQSCPDITMLPKLAEIFGTTTDELLGHGPKEKVHQAEVVEETCREPEEMYSSEADGKWELSWENSKKGAVSFAVLVLLTGGLTLVSRILHWDVSFWDILWPSALLIFGLHGLMPKFSLFRLGFALFGGYFLLENLNVVNLDLSGELIFPIVLVLFGIGLLVDALRKPRKARFEVLHNGKSVANGKHEAQNQYHVDGECLICHTAFGENHQHVRMARLSEGEIHCSFGELTVDLSGCEEITDGCELEAHCNFGQLILLVPAKYRVKPESSTAFASLSFTGQPSANPAAMIDLDASVSFGEIEIRYI